MKALSVFYTVVASVIEFGCLKRRGEHRCLCSGCCLYSVVYILASALTMVEAISVLLLLLLTSSAMWLDLLPESRILLLSLSMHAVGKQRTQVVSL